jgi:hypothetical protein
VADIAAQAPALKAVGAYEYWSANLTGGETPERVQAYRVTGPTFALLGVPALVGRGLAESDTAAGAPDVAVLSYGLWQRHFAGRPSVVGREVLLDGRSHTVVGIMPRRFEFPVFNFKGDLWSPLKADRAAAAPLTSVVAVGRLQSGVSYAKAQAESTRSFGGSKPRARSAIAG